MFMTGRPQIGPELKRRLAGKVATLSISPGGADTTRYPHTGLGEDTNLDAMGSSLEADISKKISEDISAM